MLDVNEMEKIISDNINHLGADVVAKCSECLQCITNEIDDILPSLVSSMMAYELLIIAGEMFSQLDDADHQADVFNDGCKLMGKCMQQISLEKARNRCVLSTLEGHA